MVILVNLYAIKHYNTIQQTTLQIFLTMHLVNRGQFQGIVGQILVNLYDMPHSYTITQYLYHSPAPPRRLSANGILHHLHTEYGEFRYNLTVLKSLYRDLGFTANALYFTHVYCYNIIVPVNGSACKGTNRLQISMFPGLQVPAGVLPASTGALQSLQP